MSRIPALARRTRFGAAASVTLLLVVSLVTSLHAHDFWIVPDAFRVTPGGWVEVRGQTSSLFPTSESAVATDRIASARVFGASTVADVQELSQAGASLLLRFRPTSAGQRLVAVQLKPRTVRESPQSFRRYMDLEGAPQLRARYEREGRLPPLDGDSITRRYAKYAKTLVEVGAGGPRAFGRVAGHPLEFVPLNDPSTLRPGQPLRVRLLFRGRPVAGAHLHAGAVRDEPSARSDTASARLAAQHDVSSTTDARGEARIPVDRDGLWNVRTIHIVPADAGSGADWDVHWATLVFGVGGRPADSGSAPTPSRASDSLRVAEVVRRYGDALAAGDSATALALLAADAVILESGGAESREEYRGHHLPSDIAFARAVPSQDSPIHVTVVGDAAWAWSTSVSQGTFRGREVNSAGAELMVLTRGGDGAWRIRAIHWSSRARRP